MFAIITTGGKQYKVAKDDVIKIEKVAGEKGSTVTLDDVLMVGEEGNVAVGSPTIEGASVTAEVLDQARDKKIIVFKKKRRKNYRRKNGHRQDITVLKITDIAATAAKKKAAPKKNAKAAEKTAAPEAKATPQKTETKPKAQPKAKSAAKKTAAAKKAPAKAKAAPKKAAAKPKAKETK